MSWSRCCIVNSGRRETGQTDNVVSMDCHRTPLMDWSLSQDSVLTDRLSAVQFNAIIDEHNVRQKSRGRSVVRMVPVNL